MCYCSTIISPCNKPSKLDYSSYVMFVGCPVGAILHIVGLYLLTTAKKSTMHTNDRLIIFNLSLANLFLNIALFYFGIINFSKKCAPAWLNVLLEAFLFAYYITTVLLTLNRFLMIRLNVRYDLFWSKEKTKWCLFVSWICSLADGYLISGKDCVLFTAAAEITFDAILIVLSLYVYGYALKISRDMSKIKSLIRSSKTFRKGLILPALIVTIYIIFIGVPKFIVKSYLFWVCKRNGTLDLIVDTGWVLGMWGEAVVYIYINHFLIRLVNKPRAKFPSTNLYNLENKQLLNKRLSPNFVQTWKLAKNKSTDDVIIFNTQL